MIKYGDNNKKAVLNILESILKVQLNLSDIIKNVSIEDLLDIMNNQIDDESYKSKLFEYYIGFILNKSKSIQNHEIKWNKIDDETLKDRPIAEFNNHGVWTSLITYKNDKNHNTLLFTLDVFRNELSNNKRRVLIMK